MHSPCDLDGLGILVTRPAPQGERLCELIRGANGRPLAFPTIEILPTPAPQSARALLNDTWDLVILISTNAVDHALALGADGRWPGARRLAAVGKTTASALGAAGRAPELVPSTRYDSESLLAMPDLSQMTGKRVLIIRGHGGRGLLGDTLSGRGASVHYAEVYRRAVPAVSTAPLIARWRDDVQVITATSDEVLNNLMSLLGDTDQHLALATPLVVISQRTADTARAIGFRHIRIANRADDTAVVRAICAVAASLQ